MPTPDPKRLPRHPAIAQYRRVFFAVVTIGVLLSGCSVLVGGGLTGTLPLLGLVALVLVLLRSLEENATGVQLINHAMQLVATGELDEAEAYLDQVSPRAMWAAVPRAVAVLRAMIALQRGKPDDALAATAIADRRVGLLMRGHLNAQRASLLTFRALAYVAKGDHARAVADAAAAETLEEAAPDTLARARLVRALVLSREGKQDELAAHLRDNATLLLEHGSPRDRIVTRALRRMARAGGRSVYREPGKRGDEGARSHVTDWVATLAPEAASFVDAPEAVAQRAAPGEAPPASMAEVRAIDAVRAKAARSSGRTLALRAGGLWAALVVGIIGIWTFLTPSDGRHPDAPAPPPPAPESTLLDTLTPLLLLFGAGVATLVASMKVQHRGYLALARANRAVALGDVEAAQKQLWGLVTKSGLTGPTAQAGLANLASREARFLDAVSHAEAAILRVQQSGQRVNAHDLLMPGLLTELAVAKAALGRSEEASAELAVLARDHAQYAYLASSTLRVRLLQAAREGDWARAATLASARTPETGITRAEELLADLCVAAVSHASEEERQRLATDLAEPRLQRWIDAVAPRLRDVVAQGGARVATPVAAEGATTPEPRERLEHAEDHADAEVAGVAMRARS